MLFSACHDCESPQLSTNGRQQSPPDANRKGSMAQCKTAAGSLDYAGADLASRMATVEVWDDGLLLRIPPLPRWVQLGSIVTWAAYLAAHAVFVGYLFLSFIRIARSLPGFTFPISQFITPVLIYAAGFALLAIEVLDFQRFGHIGRMMQVRGGVITYQRRRWLWGVRQSGYPIDRIDAVSVKNVGQTRKGACRIELRIRVRRRPVLMIRFKTGEPLLADRLDQAMRDALRLHSCLPSISR